MIQRKAGRAAGGAAIEATAAMGSTKSGRSGEVVLVGAVVPNHLLLVLERERGHVAGNRGLLAYGRRCDGLFLAQHRLNEIAEMVDGAVRFLEFLWPIDVDRRPRLDRFGRTVGSVG